MKNSIYNVFKTALKEYLIREGKYFLDEELCDLTSKMLSTAVMENLQKNSFKKVNKLSL